MILTEQEKREIETLIAGMKSGEISTGSGVATIAPIRAKGRERRQILQAITDDICAKIDAGIPAWRAEDTTDEQEAEWEGHRTRFHALDDLLRVSMPQPAGV